MPAACESKVLSSLIRRLISAILKPIVKDWMILLISIKRLISFELLISNVTFDPIQDRENTKIFMNENRIDTDKRLLNMKNKNIPMLLRLESRPRKITLR